MIDTGTELVPYFAYRGVNIGTRALLNILILWFWLYRSHIPCSRKKEGYFLVQMISTCLRGAWTKGGEGQCGWNGQKYCDSQKDGKTNRE
jgi:hypothetical protein